MKFLVERPNRKRLKAVIIALTVIVAVYCLHARARWKADYRSLLNGKAPIKSITFDGQQRHIFVDDPQIIADLESDFRTGHTSFPGEGGYLEYNAVFVLKSGVKIDTRIGLYKSGYPFFTWDDIKNSPKFVNRLKLHTDPVSAFLFQKMVNYPNCLDGILTNWESFAATEYAGQCALIGALDIDVIQGFSIYDSNRFHDISLRPETLKLIHDNPKGTNLILLNRR
jgi:hypothetical protein